MYGLGVAGVLLVIVLIVVWIIVGILLIIWLNRKLSVK
jgi:purine-cytosine permease-like protein